MLYPSVRRKLAGWNGMCEAISLHKGG